MIQRLLIISCFLISIFGYSQINEVVYCDEDPVNSVICYQIGETTEVIYTSDDPDNSLSLTVNSGVIYEFGNDFKVFDSDGTTELYSGAGDGGDLTGITVQSTGDQISILYTPLFYSCDMGMGLEALDISVSCATCTNLQASFETVPDCDSGEQFLVEVDLTDMGSASSIDISDDQGSDVQTVSSTGVYEFGPYNNGTDVKITLTNVDDETCHIISNKLTEKYCSALTVQCGEEPVISVICFDGDETVEVTYTSSDPDGILNLTINAGVIGAYVFAEEFKIFDSDGTTLLYSGTGENGDLSGITVQSTGDELSISYTAGIWGCNSQNYAAFNIEVSCSGCVNPEATFTPVNDCGNDDDLFMVDVEVTDFGTAETVEVTDDQGGNPQTLTEPGVVSFGPYLYYTPAHITVTNADDPICAITSDPIIQNFCGVKGYADEYTHEELVTDVLINNPCAQISNVTSRTGTDFNDSSGIGYFTNNSEDFPIDSGVVLSTGYIQNINGPLNNMMGDGTIGWQGDNDINDLIHEIEGDDSSLSVNASVLEFDFVPVVDHISFDYVFVSDEYGSFQCSYTDAFAFFLTDEDGNTSNLAVIPNTDTPVSPRTIRDNAYNSDCSSENPEYFNNFYGEPNGLPTETAPTNFRGSTVKMTAEANVVPGQTYHIKLVIADRDDPTQDSAVFLQAGSLDIGEIDLGEDLIVGNETAPCENEEVVLYSGIEDDDFVDFSWYKDGELLEGENGPTISVTEPGEYTVLAIYAGDCVLSDEITVEFAPIPEFDFEDEIYSLCGSDSVILDATPINESEFNNLEYIWSDVEGEEIPDENESTYEVDQPGTYTVEVISGNGCSATHTFEVTDADFTIDLGDDQTLCDQDSFDLTAEVIGSDSNDASYEWEGPDGTLDHTGQTISVSDSGIYTVFVTIGECTGETSVSIDFNESPVFDLGNDIATGDLEGIELDATPTNTDPDTATYEWNYNGNPIPEDGPIVYPTDYGYGTYTVTTYGDDPGCDATQSITITEQEIICNVTIEADKQLVNTIQYCEDEGIPSYEITFTANFEIENGSAENVEYTWFKNDEEIPNATGNTYTVTYDEQGNFTDDITVQADVQGCHATATISTDINIAPYEHPCKITEGLSPGNNDGLNDYLDLTFLNDRSGIAEFIVYNRYGVKVYSKNNYVDSWRGQDKSGNELVTGTYYYVIKMKNEDPVFGRVHRGWIYINQHTN